MDTVKNKTFVTLIFILIILTIIKLPSIISTDIQPWDEGMYALRVLSIKINGDFLDQSSHSTGGFYSASHPPLLIWAGYFITLLTGLNATSLKLFIFILSLLCLLMIVKTGEIIFDRKTGLIAALIFSSNLIFNIFSKRFQFDIPYTLLILTAFYLFLKFAEKRKPYLNLLAGIVFGLCLMIKILVGIYIPMIIFITYIFLRGRLNYNLRDLIIMTLTGIIIALPWHIYMFAEYGKAFTDYFFFYHIFERAFTGVEHNTKESGALFHINYLLEILPYGIIIFAGFFKSLINIKKLNYKEIFLFIWFSVGLLIITVFRTKLEAYTLLILAPGVLIGSDYISKIDTDKIFKNIKFLNEKFLLIFLIFINSAWSVVFYLRIEEGLKISFRHLPFSVYLGITAYIILSLIISYIISRHLSVQKAITYFIVFCFLFINVFYAIRIPYWENTFKITDIKDNIDKEGKKNILYIASNYRANPQFSFYFNGLDLGWNNNQYTYNILDTKNGNEKIKIYLDTLEKNKYDIILERPGINGSTINRGYYPPSDSLIPDSYKLIIDSPGYKLYR